VLSEPELLEFCAARMVKYKRPVRVLFLDALPRTAARKIDKRTLRGLAASNARSDA
jgi:acyl-CoA synthetase (AMP-forming)/AMP-acid ligase II